LLPKKACRLTGGTFRQRCTSGGGHEAGQCRVHQPVEVTLPNGLLTAKRLGDSESGVVIRFNRGVVLTA